MILPDETEVATRVAALRARVDDGSMELLGAPGGLRVVIVSPDPVWTTRFEIVRGRLAEALGTTAERIDHVGSTSVPGLAAKPIVDVQVSVRDLEDEAAYAAQIEDLGWPMRVREPEQRFFREPGREPRTAHVHVCQRGSDWERVHLLFRDYLRAHPARARQYGDLKAALAVRYPEHGQAYTEAKGPFIDETLALADRWAADTGWRI